MVAAALRTIFAQPSQEAARRQLRAVYDVMASRWIKVAQVLINAEDEILAYMIFPQDEEADLFEQCV